MFDKLSTFTAQGNLGEARAIYELTKLGYVVSKPLNVNNKYDLIVDSGESLQKVSVKTSYNKTKSGAYEVAIRTSGGNSSKNNIRLRSEGDFDLLFVMLDNNECYLIPESALSNARNSITVGNKYREFLLG
jgi:PD-(D/E)XK endonuclease